MGSQGMKGHSLGQLTPSDLFQLGEEEILPRRTQYLFCI